MVVFFWHWDRILFPTTGFQTSAGIFRTAFTNSRPHLLNALIDRFFVFLQMFFSHD